ncbi:MAG: hypothetical protein JWM12_2883 [Ilumatobacteraceae bacterium]|jgi:hypothetical protein|nr:hypothetical protein [Ilumatobacteraceae bacterium]
MLIAIGIVVVVVALAAAIWLAVVRRPRQDAGIVGFRRHIDALSPESRREVQERVRDQHDRSDDVDDGQT